MLNIMLTRKYALFEQETKRTDLFLTPFIYIYIERERETHRQRQIKRGMREKKRRRKEIWREKYCNIYSNDYLEMIDE